MGMYNECHIKCPHCGKTTTFQIRQIVMGFGGFDLDAPLTPNKDMELAILQELFIEVQGAKKQWCEHCNSSFKVQATTKTDVVANFKGIKCN